MTRKIDVCAIHTGNHEHCIAIEIKISHADFMRDTLTEKFRDFIPLSTEFYYAVPAGLINPNHVPSECGLIEVRDSGLLDFSRQAEKRPAIDSVIFSFWRAAIKRAAGQ
jgi:hypothetical protein